MGNKTENKQPDWLLTDEWGISRDSVCWMLVYRPNTAKSDKWHAKAFFGRIDQLIDNLYRYVALSTEIEDELKDHMTKCSRDVAEAATRLAMILEKETERENDKTES